MSKVKVLAAAIAQLFPKSGKAISEKLSSEEYSEFSEDATEIDKRLSAQGDGNEKVVKDLETANATIEELNGKLTSSEGKVTDLQGKLQKAESDRDTFKSHYDKAKSQGTSKPDEDENSKGTSDVADYNSHAQEVFAKFHGTK